MATSSREAGGTASAAWQAALFPVLILLGITLPLIFLARIDQYLYYLRPIELLPTYATAWLLLAALSLLPFSMAALALGWLRRGALRPLGALLGILMFWIAAAAAIIAILFGTVVWLQTFSSVPKVAIESRLGGALAMLSIALSVPLAATRIGRALLLKLRPAALFLAALGGVSTLSLPFFRWNSAPAPATASDSMQASAMRPDRPNIVLVTIDALSAQHMSLYGAKRQTTPRLDALGLEASVFDRFYANSNFTTSSIASILTGTRPWTHRAFQIFSWPTEATRRTSLPAQLARAGYWTGYVATNSFAGASRLGFGTYFRFGRGDEVPVALSCPDRISAILPYECPAVQVLPLLFVQKFWIKLQTALVIGRSNRHYDPSQGVQAALEALKVADRHRPVFLWLHLFPPHSPYAAPEPWLGRFDASSEARDLESSNPEDNYVFRNLAPEYVRILQARYDESVQYVDQYAGDFVTHALQMLGDNTVVVVTSDHGEGFANGYGGHGGPGLYDSIIHVPLIVKLPHQRHPMRIAALVEQVDLAPTLADLAGITPPASWEGRSLLPLCTGAEASQTLPLRPVFAMNFEENHRRSALTTGSVAVIEGPWKLVRYTGALHYPQMPHLDDELYDLLSDPGETANRASDEPTELEHLRGLVTLELNRYGGTVR